MPSVLLFTLAILALFALAIAVPIFVPTQEHIQYDIDSPAEVDRTSSAGQNPPE